MSVNLVEHNTRPEGLPPEAMWPQPNVNQSINRKGWSRDRGWSLPTLPTPRFEDELVLAILSPAYDEDLSDEAFERERAKRRELDQRLKPICGGYFGHSEFCLPWDEDEDDEPLAHYLGVIARDEMGDAVTKLVKAGVPIDWIVLLDWEGDRVWPVLRNS